MSLSWLFRPEVVFFLLWQLGTAVVLDTVLSAVHVNAQLLGIDAPTAYGLVIGVVLAFAVFTSVLVVLLVARSAWRERAASGHSQF